MAEIMYQTDGSIEQFKTNVCLMWESGAECGRGKDAGSSEEFPAFGRTTSLKRRRALAARYCGEASMTATPYLGRVTCITRTDLLLSKLYMGTRSVTVWVAMS